MDGDTAQRANDSRWAECRPGGRPHPGRRRAHLASSANVWDQNPKKSAGRLSGARKPVTAAAYPSPHDDQTGAGPEAPAAGAGKSVVRAELRIRRGGNRATMIGA